MGFSRFYRNLKWPPQINFNFLWAQKLKKLKSEIIQISQSHSPRYGDVQVFKGFTKIQNGRHGRTLYFFVGTKNQKLKSEKNHILQSHYPPSENMQVILLKFKMTTTSRLFKYL